MAVCETEAPQHLHLTLSSNNVVSPQGVFLNIDAPEIQFSSKKKKSAERHNRRINHNISHANLKEKVYREHIPQVWHNETTEMAALQKTFTENKSKKTKKEKGEKTSKKNDVLPVSNINDENRSQSVFQQRPVVQQHHGGLNGSDLSSPGLVNPQSHDGRCNSTPSSNPFSVPPPSTQDNLRFFEEFSPASMELVDANFLDELSGGNDIEVNFNVTDINALLDNICGELVPESPLLRTVDELDRGYYPQRFPGEPEPIKSEGFPGMMERCREPSFLNNNHHPNHHSPGSAFPHHRGVTNPATSMGHYNMPSLPQHLTPEQIHRIEQQSRRCLQQEEACLVRPGQTPNMMIPSRQPVQPDVGHFRLGPPPKQPVSSFGLQDVPNPHHTFNPNQTAPPPQLQQQQQLSYGLNAQQVYTRQIPVETARQMPMRMPPNNNEIRWSNPDMNYQQQAQPQSNNFDFANYGQQLQQQQQQNPRAPYVTSSQQRPRQTQVSQRNYVMSQQINGASGQYTNQLQQPPVYQSNPNMDSTRQMTGYRPAMNVNYPGQVRGSNIAQHQYAPVSQLQQQPNYYQQAAVFSSDQQVFVDQHYGDVSSWNGG